jgi:hypothetical protein
VYLTDADQVGGYYGGTKTFATGDDVTLELRSGADTLPDGGDNSYLFYQAQRGLQRYSVQQNATISFTFREEHVPSTTMYGVWFNGRTYLETNYPYTLRFDPAERELNIEITTDAERYAPGDQTTLEVRVTDAEGEPQRDAEVNLAVVDEALFQLQGPYRYEQDVLQQLYRQVGSGVVLTYASHQYPDPDTAAEQGGGGGPRVDFADVAFFGSVTTGSDGRASVTFELPDNLTSWRVTAKGVTADLKAGTVLHQIPVGLPFFVDVTMNDEYLASDRPEIKVRSFGSDLQSGQEVTFEVSAASLGLTEPVTVSAEAFQAARVPLPELREGAHEILIEGRAGEMEDSLIRTVRVVPSRLVSGQARFYELAAGLDIEGASDRPTRVVFSDHERGRYFPLLQQLRWGSGDRVDQQLARDLAAALLETSFEEVETLRDEFDVALYQTPDGGIALFPYADDELGISARVAALAPDRVGRTGLGAYFLRIAENRTETRERQIIALYGLAALGEPVLVPLQQALEEEDLTWRERLYLGLAAMELGDDTTAGQVFQALIDDFGESRAPNYRLVVGEDQDDILEATSLAAILGAGIGDEVAPALFDYTTDNYTKDILVELEQISYLTQALPRLSQEPVRFAYTLNGDRQEIELARGGTFALQVSPEELETIELEPVEGRAGVASFFTAPLRPEDVERDPNITITRRYDDAEPGASVELEAGALVRITLSAEFGAQALDGCYQAADLLPSGLKVVTRPYSYGLSFASYPYEIEGQRVSFCLSDSPFNRAATYFARVVSAGEYTAEPAVMQSMQSAESITLTDAVEVDIQ